MMRSFVINLVLLTLYVECLPPELNKEIGLVDKTENVLVNQTEIVLVNQTEVDFQNNLNFTSINDEGIQESDTANLTINSTNVKINAPKNATAIFINLFKENLVLKKLIQRIINSQRKTSQPSDAENRNVSSSEGLNNHDQSMSYKASEIFPTENKTLSLEKNLNDSNTKIPDGMNDDYYYDYPEAHSQNFVNHSDIHSYDSYDYDYVSPYAVRKCCGLLEFFSIEYQGCVSLVNASNFRYSLEEMMSPDVDEHYEIRTGTIQNCPGKTTPPQIFTGVTSQTHELHQGFLHNVNDGTSLNQDHYCLELVGYEEKALELTAAMCFDDLLGFEDENKNAVSVIRKCCPLNHYYDGIMLDCFPNVPKIREIDSLMKEFSRNDSENVHLEIGILHCRGKPPMLVNNLKAYISEKDQLCVTQTGRCYPISMYCIEYVWSADDHEAEATAVYCPLDTFYKCCPSGSLVSDDTCVEKEEILSSYMAQIKATMDYEIGFPVQEEGAICVHLEVDEYDGVRWWIQNSGHLAIDFGETNFETMNYCVDDFQQPSGDITAKVHICSDKLKDSLALPITAFDVDALGKCCPHGHHLSPTNLDCVPGNKNRSMENDPIMRSAGYTKLGYTDIPQCSHHHLYTFSLVNEDHVEFDSESKLHVVSVDGKCIERKAPLSREQFCIDYGYDENDPELASAIICAPEWDRIINAHPERFPMIGVFLIISSIFLLITLIDMLTLKVQQGFMTVNKVRI